MVRQDPQLTTLQRDLLEWGAHTRRDLPWRRTRDPWAVLVSELMLQQTQAPRVAPKFEAFLERFPTVAECAAASVGDVVGAWAGLGYNRRAVHLHRASVVVRETYGGVIPDDLAALLTLPGVGPYTARAVLVFAFERDLGLVDTNAGRFVARALAGTAVTSAEAQARADAAVPQGHGWAWGQAVFDLGAAVCAKRAPSCGDCPIARSCAWASAGWPDPDPALGSAGVSRGQSAFAGSFRQGRGRLVNALRAGPVNRESVAAAAGWPEDPERAARAVASLVADGLAVVDGDGTVAPP
ncbi:MAG: A/G-specific adenine glycosylase [Acidimicrobiaceae bacterium]|nr:A/G-specific adenine glycosylase [Acidimicrobiaceae bacterium]